MIVHVFNNQKKFSRGYFKMLSDNGFNFDNMMLIHYGKKDSYFAEIGLNTKFISNFFNPFENMKLIGPLMKADKVIVHSLASPFLLLLIALSPSIGNKIHWVIWGKDLYFYQMLERPKIYHKIYEAIRKKAISRIKNVISIFREDYELAVKWYHIKAENIEVVTLYPYALDLTISEDKPDNSAGYTILLGNSASYTNNHIEALETLSHNKEDIKKIVCPLSYGGNKSYVRRVMQMGESLFGDKFIPLVEFMEKEQYFELLRTVDIGVFNYSRQEGLGNIWSLMLSGKTIYMRMPTSTTSFFRRNGIKVLDIEELKHEKIRRLSQDELRDNIRLLEPLINVEASMKRWNEILR